MDNEYLDDYAQKEREEFGKLESAIKEGRFTYGKDRYPSDERFFKLQDPVAVTVGAETTSWDSIWAQIPFSGSLILLIPPYSQRIFEKVFFEVSEIPEVIDFIKKSGRLQIALNNTPLAYAGLDYMKPLLEQLRPPYCHGAPGFIFETEKEMKKHVHVFFTLASVKFLKFLKEATSRIDSRFYEATLIQFQVTYAILKAGQYFIAEDIEDLLIDDPVKAFTLLCVCRDFVVDPITDLRSNIRNHGLENARRAQMLPPFYRPQLRFPCEIGKFLMEKMTYAPKDMRGCNQMIDNYDAYDLRKVQSALNEAIITNCPDAVNRSAEELSEILDNIWSDRTIPRRIENMKIGLPVSIAAVGGIAGLVTGGPLGAASGVGIGDFLTKLGFKVGEKTIEKLFDIKGSEVAEKVAKLRTKNYQANIYDFQKKYKGKIKS